MRTKALLSFGLFALLIAGFFFYNQEQITSTQPLPAPTNGKTFVKKDVDEEGNQDLREAWIESMHKAAPGTDWRAIEYQNSLQRHEQRVLARSTASSRSADEVIANGLITGEWKERGSRNQAGSVVATYYDKEEDNIYLISAGGSFWKGARDGSKWEVLNQDLRFHERFLEAVQTTNGRRWLAITGGKPHYSDDEGQSWNVSNIFFVNSSGSSEQGIVLDDADQSFFILAKKSGNDNISVYKSSDKGERFIAVQSFSESNYNNMALCNPRGTNDIYLAQKIDNTSTRFYKYNWANNQMELIINNGGLGFGRNGRANLIGQQINDTLRFLVYSRDSLVYVSDDEGINWSVRGKMPRYPWATGVFMSPSNPNFLLMGEVECWRSPNGGKNWQKINNWWDYYSDVPGKMHADFMFIDEYETSNGEPFIAMSNHGGLNVSYDYTATTPNIGLLGLNVNQYYDVRTDPVNDLYVYGGTQDQGFHRGFAFSNNVVISMDQVISGDYGHIEFSDNGRRLWTVYPFGSVSYYNDPQENGWPTDGYDFESSQESVWIPPLMAGPDPAANEIYMAGGNIEGGTGSHIIRLQIDESVDTIVPSQLPFDFRSEADGELSAMEISKINPDHWYVATTNGRFFYSTDRGQNWEQTLDFLPTGQYLYGAAIYPSKVDDKTVYFGGSGYSNPGIYKSTDNGFTFLPMTEGLPPTLIIGLAANTDESLIFAATESGPYVYVAADDYWYDMSGISAPNQTYWTVEYLEKHDIVRFGTYGRGIWDFNIKEINSTSTNNNIAEEGRLKAFPNPTTGLVNVEWTSQQTTDAQLQVFDISGRLLTQQNWNPGAAGKHTTQLDLQNYPSGSYIVRLSSAEGNGNIKVLKK